MECTTMEVLQAQNAPEAGCGTEANQTVALTRAHLSELELRERNQRDLEALREVISVEEGEYLSAEEALSRVLGFYNRFVPFRGTYDLGCHQPLKA